MAVVLFASVMGCAKRFHPHQVPKTKILISNFEMAPGLRDTPKAVRGWWMGAENIYQNPRSGGYFADRLNAYLPTFPYIKLFSRLDLKYYFAPKRKLLQDTYPHLTDAEVTDLLAQVPNLDYARELGADKVLSGRIVESHMHENRTFHWWKSVFHVEVRLVDVMSGQVDWEREYRETMRFASPEFVMEEIAKQVGEDLEKGYFRPLMLAQGR